MQVQRAQAADYASDFLYRRVFVVVVFNNNNKHYYIVFFHAYTYKKQ